VDLEVDDPKQRAGRDLQLQPADRRFGRNMTPADHIVYVVDDDPRVHEALTELLSSASFNAVAFGAVAESLMQSRPELPGRLVLDVHMPDVNGLDFRKQLAATDHFPIVFITGHGDIPTSVRAFKAGTLDFVTKPLSDEALLPAVVAAISMDDRGCWRNNVFVERLWRSIKYEEVYLHAYESVTAAKAGVGRYLDFYNRRRPHTALGDRTTDEAYFIPQTVKKAA
jgi:ActR/RegA family two-component response regulator